MSFKIHDGNEGAGVLSLKTQSPSTLRWRLGVEVRRTCRFETTVRLGTPVGLMDSRRYRSGATSNHFIASRYTKDSALKSLPRIFAAGAFIQRFRIVAYTALKSTVWIRSPWSSVLREGRFP